MPLTVSMSVVLSVCECVSLPLYLLIGLFFECLISLSLCFSPFAVSVRVCLSLSVWLCLYACVTLTDTQGGCLIISMFLCECSFLSLHKLSSYTIVDRYLCTRQFILLDREIYCECTRVDLVVL